MITLSIQLGCDGCSRQTQVNIENTSIFPAGEFLLHSFGFKQFLAGPLLCEQCAQNQEAVERVSRIHQRIVSDTIEAEKPVPTTVLQIAESKTEPNSVAPRVAKRWSDEEIQSALTRYSGNVTQSARELGCTTATIYSRIGSGRVFQYSHSNRTVVPVQTTATVAA